MAVVGFLLLGQPLRELTGAAPPVEELSVEAARLTPGLISLSVRADGSAPVAVAQVQVDGAWRGFTPDAGRADRPARDGAGRHPVSLGRGRGAPRRCC